MEVVLIRHTAVDVPAGVCYGQTDVPTKSTFPEEAAQTLRMLQPYQPFDHVFCSPLSRCRKLAASCGYPHPQLDKRLMEINFGEWEMQAFNENKDPRLLEWYQDYLHVPATGGESFEMLFRRVSSFLDELKTLPYQKVAIFAHGGVLISAQIYAGVLKPEDAVAALTPYGGLITLTL